MKNNIVHIIGAGLAGSEAAYFLLKKGYEVHLYERRPEVNDQAHVTGNFGELVCSNSLKSKRLDNACGLLKEEMKIMGSIMMESALENEVPSGNALSVDREGFACSITTKLLSFPNLIVHREDISTIPEGNIIIATGPLTSDNLLKELQSIIGLNSLSFFDASAPIVSKDSIDFSKAYFKSRWEQDDSSYINCPFTKEEYLNFVNELVNGEKAILHSFDTKYFEGCLPIEVIASRGPETLRHGPMKPFGLGIPSNPKPYAVIQLRQDSALGDYYNLVGFQTNLKYGEQKRIFHLIPGLENAKFVRYGLMHKNSYICSPECLNADLSLKNQDNVYIAGQLAGVEGYVESAVLGIISAINLDRKIQGKNKIEVPAKSITGALINYIINASPKNFSPMNANWALMPGENKEVLIQECLNSITKYWNEINE